MTCLNMPEIARELAVKHGRVTADDVQAELIARIKGYTPSCLGNAAGSIFKKGFTMIGHTLSARVSSHGNLLRVWKLTD